MHHTWACRFPHASISGVGFVPPFRMLCGTTLMRIWCLQVIATCILRKLWAPSVKGLNEPQLRDLIRALCHDFGLRIANPPRVSTHRSGSCIDIVLVSRPLDVVDIVVHDGGTCGCQRDSCHPIVGSDHKLITFKIAVPPEADDVVPKPWPRVRNWHSVVQDLQPQLLQWASKLLNLRQGQPLPLPERRGVLDLLYAEFVAIVWQAAEPHASSRSGGSRRPQPDWWDDACYELLVARNAAWRQWRREQTSSARETFRQKRLEFHHLVRRKKSSFWSSWLSRQKGLSRSNPQLAAFFFFFPRAFLQLQTTVRGSTLQEALAPGLPSAGAAAGGWVAGAPASVRRPGLRAGLASFRRRSTPRPAAAQEGSWHTRAAPPPPRTQPSARPTPLAPPV